MHVLDWCLLGHSEREDALARPRRGSDPAIRSRVAEILGDVAERGEPAVRDWSIRLDGHAPRRVAIDAPTVADATERVDPADFEALRFAANAVRSYHELTRPLDSPAFEPVAGVRVQRVWRAITPVGLYVPGGSAPLFSTLLHLAIPAAVAGCAERVVVTPPGKGGSLHPMMILAAHFAGVEAVHLLGGAQAIGALAIGAGVPRCAKIFGPGNAWVAEAKRQVAEFACGPAIDLPAGPSELMVVADGSADPAKVAIDLLSQAEHDAAAQVMLVALSPNLVDLVRAELTAVRLPRSALAGEALAHSRCITVKGRADAIEIVNAYAPEHLSLQVADAGDWLPHIRNAGTIFVGDGAAETFGDYLAGPSHVLPTDGAARAWSGVSVASFMKSMAVQSATPAGASALAPAAARLARAEGLEAHARAAELRA